MIGEVVGCTVRALRWTFDRTEVYEGVTRQGERTLIDVHDYADAASKWRGYDRQHD